MFLEGEMVGSPVNVGVPFFQPGFSKDNVVVRKGYNSKVDVFFMVLEM